MEAMVKVIENQGLAVAIILFIGWKGSQFLDKFTASFSTLSEEAVKQTEVLRGIQAHFLKGDNDKPQA